MSNPNDPIVRLQNWWANIGTTPEYRAWKETVPPPDAAPAPAAPSSDLLTSWTPEQMYAATGEKFDAWKIDSIPYAAEPEKPKDNSLLYLAAFLGVISLFIVIRK